MRSSSVGELPRPSVEMADAVELYARESGRHATLHFVPSSLPRRGMVHGFWIVRFALKSDDKRLVLYQEGKVPEPPTDDAWLVDTYGKPLSLDELGVGGLLTFLQKGSLTSGRGEYTSLTDQLRKVREHNRETAEKYRAEQKFINRKEQRDLRRQRFGIPFVPTGLDLRGEGEPSHEARPPEQKE